MKLLKYILKQLARGIIWRYRPGIIGVTGSAGKTSTKLATAAVLKSDRYVRVSWGNFNNELGLPLTILGDYDRVGGIFFWPIVLVRAIAKIIIKGKYPELLILEYGVDRPGDMKYLLDIAKPNIGIVTAIGEIPVHVEFFAGPEAVAREKSRLVEYLPSAGFAILNHDDLSVMEMKERTRAKSLSFGFGLGSDVRITNFENKMDGERPLGIAFKLAHGGSFVPVKLDGVFGKTQGYAAAAGACVGLIFGLNLIKIAEALKDYKSLPGRTTLVPGIKETYIIDDSYNASPMAMHAALDTLKSLKAKRKVAILGDMLEIGTYTEEAHTEMGRIAAKVVKVLVTVGPRAKFIAEGAKERGFVRKNILSFETADDAKMAVQDLLKKGDLVLVKASRALHLEKIIEEIKIPEELNK